MSSSWGDSWGAAWGDSWGPLGAEEQPPADGSGLIITRRRRPVRRLDTYRTPEDIRREQLEEERYLASLEKAQQVPAKATSGAGDVEADLPDNERFEPATNVQAPVANPAAQPILADVAARAASAVQAKFEEARQAVASAQLAHDKRRRTLALLLALD